MNLKRGGKRQGAGRPRGQGKYGEPTKAIRLPISTIRVVEKFSEQGFKIPLYLSKVSAGFPSPAEDYLEDSLNLHDYLIKHPASTFFVRAIGESMLNAGIHENDILIVDRSLKPTVGKIVIAAIDGQLTVKRLQKDEHGKLLLMPDNPTFSPIELREGNDLFIWGVVTYIIHAA